MKIGILTYHRSHNYGALLQAIALRVVLQDMGHEVLYVDYWPDYHKSLYAPVSFYQLMHKSPRLSLSYLRDRMTHISPILKRYRTFQTFIRQYITPYTASTNETYDVIIHGSDQIWRKQPFIFSYNPVYFGQHAIPCQHRISYAASMGQVTTTDADRLQLRKLLSNLDSISVRESDLCQLVQSLGYPCQLHLDPTMLLSKQRWIDIFHLQSPTDTPYALFYNLLPHSFQDEAIRQYTKAHDLQLKTIYGKGTGRNTLTNIYNADPRSLVQLIYGAQCVFTSSFHGLVFAIIFQKPFYAAFSTNGGRAQSILHSLHISDRLLPPMSSTIPSDIPPLHYDLITQTFSTLQQKSLNYLRQL